MLSLSQPQAPRLRSPSPQDTGVSGKGGPLEPLLTQPSSIQSPQASLLPTSAPGRSPAPTWSQQLGVPRPGSPRPGERYKVLNRVLHTPAGMAGTAPKCGGQSALYPGARARGPCPPTQETGSPRLRVGGAGLSAVPPSSCHHSPALQGLTFEFIIGFGLFVKLLPDFEIRHDPRFRLHGSCFQSFHYSKVRAEPAGGLKVARPLVTPPNRAPPRSAGLNPLVHCAGLPAPAR